MHSVSSIQTRTFRYKEGKFNKIIKKGKKSEDLIQ